MGLDITAYNRIEKIDCVYDEDGGPIDPVTRAVIEGDVFQAYLNDNFPGRADEMVDKGCYTYEKSIGLRAGSYGGYNSWRDQLAELAGYPKGQYEQYSRQWDSHCVACWNGATGPFSELINFSDCEGIIGPSVSKKLAADFAEFQTRADALVDERFAAKYREWRAAFELAADGGCVQFH
jgi:hypothetical protein